MLSSERRSRLSPCTRPSSDHLPAAGGLPRHGGPDGRDRGSPATTAPLRRPARLLAIGAVLGASSTCGRLPRRIEGTEAVPDGPWLAISRAACWSAARHPRSSPTSRGGAMPRSAPTPALGLARGRLARRGAPPWPACGPPRPPRRADRPLRAPAGVDLRPSASLGDLVGLNKECHGAAQGARRRDRAAPERRCDRLVARGDGIPLGVHIGALALPAGDGLAYVLAPQAYSDAWWAGTQLRAGQFAIPPSASRRASSARRQAAEIQREIEANFEGRARARRLARRARADGAPGAARGRSSG